MNFIHSQNFTLWFSLLCLGVLFISIYFSNKKKPGSSATFSISRFALNEKIYFTLYLISDNVKSLTVNLPDGSDSKLLNLSDYSSLLGISIQLFVNKSSSTDILLLFKLRFQLEEKTYLLDPNTGNWEVYIPDNLPLITNESYTVH